jgi:hypothetical protein
MARRQPEADHQREEETDMQFMIIRKADAETEAGVMPGSRPHRADD